MHLWLDPDSLLPIRISESRFLWPTGAVDVYFFSMAVKGAFPSFLARLAARFSFRDMAAFFLVSFLGL